MQKIFPHYTEWGWAEPAGATKNLDGEIGGKRLERKAQVKVIGEEGINWMGKEDSN